MAITFDFQGSLQLASQLEAIADDVENAMASRQGPRDAALNVSNFRGPFATTHRALAQDEDAQRRLADACRDAAGRWASAWTMAVDDHNAEEYSEALRRMRGINESRVRSWRYRNLNDDLYVEPYPRLGHVTPPRPASRPSGSSYSATASFVTYVPGGVNLDAVYRSSP